MPTGFPSTTEVLSSMGLVPDFDAIAARNARVIEARDRGKRIHAVVEELIADRFSLPAADATDDERRVAEQVARWYDDEGYDLIRLEERIVHRSLRYTGQPDHILQHRCSKRIAVADLKTGSMKCAGHRLQVAAYVELYLDDEHAKTGQRAARGDVDAIIIYANTSRLEVDRVPMRDHVLGWINFERAIHLWHFRHTHGLLPKPKQYTATGEPF